MRRVRRAVRVPDSRLGGRSQQELYAEATEIVRYCSYHYVWRHRCGGCDERNCSTSCAYADWHFGRGDGAHHLTCSGAKGGESRENAMAKWRERNQRAADVRGWVGKVAGPDSTCRIAAAFLCAPAPERRGSGTRRWHAAAPSAKFPGRSAPPALS